jgi:hypothetical protein
MNLKSHPLFVDNARMPKLTLGHTPRQALEFVASRQVGGFIVTGIADTPDCYLTLQVLDDHLESNETLGSMLARHVLETVSVVREPLDLGEAIQHLQTETVYPIVDDGRPVGWLLNSRGLMQEFEVPQPRCPRHKQKSPCSFGDF